MEEAGLELPCRPVSTYKHILGSTIFMNLHLDSDHVIRIMAHFFFVPIFKSMEGGDSK